MRLIPGDGAKDARLFLLGERPGRDENRVGVPFVGKAGMELWRYLWLTCHLQRHQVYVTNIVKDYLDGDPDPLQWEIDRDHPILEAEFKLVNPPFIATLGRFATRSLLGDVDMDACHGLPFLVGDACVVPIFHPAAGLHNTEIQALIQYDFEQLALVMAGKIEPNAHEDEYPNPKYLDVARLGNGKCKEVAVDTEGSKAKPWGMSLSDRPGSAYVLAGKGVEYSLPDARLILHNSMHDLDVLAALGLRVPDEGFDDTMIMAYNLCLEPQGLKQLARRHLGMEMMSYDEILGDADRRLMEDWFHKVVIWLDSRSTKESGKSSKTTRRKKKAR